MVLFQRQVMKSISMADTSENSEIHPKRFIPGRFQKMTSLWQLVFVQDVTGVHNMINIILKVNFNDGTEALQRIFSFRNIKQVSRSIEVMLVYY